MLLKRKTFIKTVCVVTFLLKIVMCKPETRTKSQQQQQKAQNVNDDYVRIIFIFFFLFPKFSTIIIYHVCENLKKKMFLEDVLRSMRQEWEMRICPRHPCHSQFCQ